MFRPHAMKQSARSPLLKKQASSLKTKKQLVVSVESVRPTPAVQERAEQLAAAARRAKGAHFLDKYRVTLPGLSSLALNHGLPSSPV